MKAPLVAAIWNIAKAVPNLGGKPISRRHLFRNATEAALTATILGGTLLTQGCGGGGASSTTSPSETEDNHLAYLIDEYDDGRPEPVSTSAALATAPDPLETAVGIPSEIVDTSRASGITPANPIPIRAADGKLYIPTGLAHAVSLPQSDDSKMIATFVPVKEVATGIQAVRIGYLSSRGTSFVTAVINQSEMAGLIAPEQSAVSVSSRRAVEKRLRRAASRGLGKWLKNLWNRVLRPLVNEALKVVGKGLLNYVSTWAATIIGKSNGVVGSLLAKLGGDAVVGANLGTALGNAVASSVTTPSTSPYMLLTKIVTNAAAQSPAAVGDSFAQAVREYAARPATVQVAV